MSPSPAPAPGTLRLISHELCPYVQRVRIALSEKGIAHDRVFIDLKNKPAWFLELSPTGRVPLLSVDGRALFESTVICEYLEELPDYPALHPGDALDRADNRAWMEFASATLDRIAAFYSAASHSELIERAAALRESFERLELRLSKSSGPFFNGPEFSLVDAAFGPVFRYFPVFERRHNFGFFDRLERVGEWRAALAERPAVQDAVVTDYPQRLLAFLKRKDGALASCL